MMPPEPFSGDQLRRVRAEAHPQCCVCSDSNPRGLALRCSLEPDGSVVATFPGDAALEGYPGLLHGGIIAALLDGAMTQCLFARGIRAFTVDLRIRYQASVTAGQSSQIRAWLEDDAYGLFQLRAQLSQNGVPKVRAAGKFMTDPGREPPGTV